MKKRDNLFFALVLSFVFFLWPMMVNAATSASASLSGNSSVYVGNTIDVTLVVSESGSGAEEGVCGVQGPISYDTSKLELVSTKSINLGVSYDSSRIIGMVQNIQQCLHGTNNIITFTFKAKELGSATVSINLDISDALGNKIYSKAVSKTISITEPPSSNAFLKSLSVDKGSINFNKNTTSYSVSVGSEVESINISASAEDSGATVSGIGSKSLSYGDNKFNIVVTAPSGSKKTYTITVNRKDIRSSNNNLANIKVNEGELSPKFSSKTTEYTLIVPYEVENLNITANAEDSKAKVTISGNNNLVAEETSDVTITVTAENGSQKTYTIKVTRGKDPNKVLDTNNYLTHLTVSVGILSPVFDKNVTNYVIWLPYEVDKITFDYAVEDTKYATVQFEGDENLKAGISNVFKIKVTAESGEERVYTISVNRANAIGQVGNDNTYLKGIELKDGELVGKFDKDTREYYYKRGKNFAIKEVIPEDENSAVSVYEDGNTIYFIVQSSNGEYGVYTLREKEFSIMPYVINVVLLFGGFTIGFMVHKIIRKRRKMTKISNVIENNYTSGS